MPNDSARTAPTARPRRTRRTTAKAETKSRTAAPADAVEGDDTANGDGSSATRYRAPALEKGLDILELLADTPTGLTQAQIARQLGRSVSEFFRMLNCLQRRGYIALQKPSDHYVLTLKLFELSHRYPPIKRLVSEAMPYMRDLSRQLDQSCHLAVIHNDRILVVAQVDNPGHLGFSVRLGAEVDLLSTASGRVLLAFAEEDERNNLLRAYLQDNDSLDPDDLQTRLQAIRASGSEEMDSHQIRGVRNISFPILDFRGEAVAALTIPFLERLDGHQAATLAEARALLQETTVEISNALGARAARPAPVGPYETDG